MADDGIGWLRDASARGLEVGVPPGGAAVRLLDAYFGSAPGDPWPGPARDPVPLWSFQAEGLVRLRRIIERRGGAILADSVGLGKTHIALALVAEQAGRDGDSVIVVPASLRAFWRRKLRLLAAPRPRVVSHTQLARGAPVAPPSGRRLVVVDEAHRFRNPRTLRYAALSRLMEPGVRLLLVTATPINNGLRDLLHLLRLFATDDGFRDLGVASLAGAFESADPMSWDEAGPGDGDTPLARIVRAVVVRRTRAMVRARFGEPAAFPRRTAPRIVPYADPLVPGRAGQVGELELPLYDGSRGGPSGGKDGRGGAAGALVRFGLLKRLDSSRLAFDSSVARLRSQTRIALEAVAAGRLPDLATHRHGDRDVDPLQLVLVEVVSRPAPPGVDLAPLARSLRRDLDRLDDLVRDPARDEAGTLDPGVADHPHPDPKLLALIRLLEHTRGERTLVFTEYRDTARAVWHGLADRFRVGRVDGGGAWLGRRSAGRRVVVERFAPHANGRGRLPSRERVDVLIATDVLAEGLNLQDARRVVSYDLPWNPVRLLQRIGRIDRAGSPHDEVVPYLFAPAAGLDEHLGLTRRLHAKLTSITATVGAEHAAALLDGLSGWDAALDDGSGIPSLRVDGALGRVEAGEDEADPVERLRTLWMNHRDERPTRVEPTTPASDPAPDRPGRGRAFATMRITEDSPAVDLAWVICVRTGRGPGSDPRKPEGASAASALLLEVDRHGRARRAGGRAVHVFEAALSRGADDQVAPHPEPGLPDDFPWRPLRELVRQIGTTASAPAPLSVHDPAGRLARRLRRALALAPGLDPELLADADHLLTVLARPLPPQTVQRLGDSLARLDEMPDPEMSGTEARRLIATSRMALAGSGAVPRRDSHDGQPIEGSGARVDGDAARIGEDADAAPVEGSDGIRIDVIGGLRILVVPGARAGPSGAAFDTPADEPADAVDASPASH